MFQYENHCFFNESTIEILKNLRFSIEKLQLFQGQGLNLLKASGNEVQTFQTFQTFQNLGGSQGAPGLSRALQPSQVFPRLLASEASRTQKCWH